MLYPDPWKYDLNPGPSGAVDWNQPLEDLDPRRSFGAGPVEQAFRTPGRTARMAGEGLVGFGADALTFLAPSAVDGALTKRLAAIEPVLSRADRFAPGVVGKAMPALKMGARLAPALGAAGVGLAAGDILLSDTTASNKAMDAAGMGLGAAIGGGLGLLSGGALSPVGAMVGSSIGKMGSDAIQALMGWDKRPQPENPNAAMGRTIL